MEKKTTVLLQLIKRPEPLIMPGGFSPYPARIAQEAGFEAKARSATRCISRWAC